MDNPQRRHDISDGAWAVLEPLLRGQQGQWGGIARDNRTFINAVLCVQLFVRTSFAKRRLSKFNGLTDDKFILHLKETEFRFNHRNDNLYKLLLNMLRDNPL